MVYKETEVLKTNLILGNRRLGFQTTSNLFQDLDVVPGTQFLICKIGMFN